MDSDEKMIVTAYRRIVGRSEWVSLADLREAVNLPRDRMDAALKALNRRPGIVLIPESEQSSMTPRVRAAALRLGGQDKHNISIERTSHDMWR